MERDIKPSHLGRMNPEYVLNRLNLPEANTEVTQIHDLGNTFRKKHSLFCLLSSRFLSILPFKPKTYSIEGKGNQAERTLWIYTFFYIMDIKQDVIFN